MTLFDVAIGFTLVGCALLVTWAYTLTQRGRTFGRDIMEVKKRTGIWITPSLVVRHWPAFALIIGSVLGIGAIAASL
ncbi:hypothetical protein [Gymnodinialimonas hymeniacidonis]|uniref:hypothetical protein n=1 Tax=Gymnodinialimonas hymeniacidonis TaxID=3126508 RepID=UPI0034C689E6